MKYSLIPLVATTVLGLASANVQVPSGCTHKDNWGNAIVENHCDFDIYYVLDNSAAGKETISPGSDIKVPVYEKPDKGGMSIKLFKDSDTDLWSVPSLTQFELTATNLLYYDISNVNSDIGNGKNGNGEACDKEPPFMNDGLKMTTTSGKSAECEAGQNPCKSAYSQYNDDFATAGTDLGDDVTLIICPGGKSSSKKAESDNSPSQPEPSPASPSPEPSSTPAPKKEVKVEEKAKKVEKVDDKAEAEVVYVTQVVTAEAAHVTVFARSPAEEKEKRQEHIHQHIHNKIHKRRHEA